jgi:hypothetical protein
MASVDDCLWKKRVSILALQNYMPPDTHPSDTPRIERVHCNRCGDETRHAVIAERIQHGSKTVDDELGIEISWRTRWTMLECCGCETVCLRRAYWFSEWDMDETMEFFPPPMARRPPRWLDQLGDEEKQLLEEVYVAVQSDSRRLAMMGARTVVDIVLSRDGDHGDFSAGLKALEIHGLIGTRQREVLQAALDVGHAAAHRGHRPSREDVETVIDIVEHLLQSELLRPAADDLRMHTPPRRPRTQHPGTGPSRSANTEPDQIPGKPTT